MLISRKVTQDKKVVTDFRHLNIRIAKNNVAWPLLKDTFSVLGSSRCEVLSVIDLKDAFHSLRLSKNSKKYCGILPYFGSTSYLYQRMSMGLNISPSILQSYLSAILDCLQSRKYCEAIMDDHLLYTPSKRSHIAKLEDLLRALLKNGLKISTKKCQLFRTELQYMGNKRLPEAARSYSITALELCALAINITTFSHLLKKVDFGVIVDHLAPTHINKVKQNHPPLE